MLSSLHVFVQQSEKGVNVQFIDNFFEMGMTADMGYPNQTTPMEVAMKLGNHKMVLKMLKNNGATYISENEAAEYCINLYKQIK